MGSLVQKLFKEKPAFFKVKFLNRLLKNHSAAVCETLLEKLNTQEINHFNTHFKEILLQRFKKALQLQSFITFEQIKSAINDLAYPKITGVFSLIGLIFILLVALSSIGIPLAASILFYLTAFSLGFFPIIGALFVVALTTTLIILPVFLTTDLIRIFIYTPINAVYKTYYLTQNLF